MTTAFSEAALASAQRNFELSKAVYARTLETVKKLKAQEWELSYKLKELQASLAKAKQEEAEEEYLFLEARDAYLKLRANMGR